MEHLLRLRVVRFLFMAFLVAIVAGLLLVSGLFTPVSTTAEVVNAATADQLEARDRMLAVKSFLWPPDASEGVAVTFPFRPSSLEKLNAPLDVRITVESRGPVAEHWEIAEIIAYYRKGGRRHRVYRGGPFPVRSSESDRSKPTRAWGMHGLKEEHYEFDLYLHKLKEGLPFDEVRRAVREQGALALRVEPVS
jgi:hypothetical protein